MPTVPSDVPTVHDLHSDANVPTPGESDFAEMAEVFEYDEQPTDAELVAMYADHQRHEAERSNSVTFANLEPLPELHPIQSVVANLNLSAWPKLSA